MSSLTNFLKLFKWDTKLLYKDKNTEKLLRKDEFYDIKYIKIIINKCEVKYDY